MFEFLFRKKDGDVVDLLEVITKGVNSLQLAAFYDEKARGMIADAIAKSEVLLTKKDLRRHDEPYFRLNVAPNDNQTGTDFWWGVTNRLLKDGRALVIRTIDGKYFLAENFSCSNYVMMKKTYYDITVTDGIDTFPMRYAVTSDNVLDLRYGTAEKRVWLKSILDTYNKTVEAINAVIKLTASPKFKYKTEANMSFRRLDKEGNAIRLTIDEVMQNLAEKLAESGITVINEQMGTTLEYLDFKTDYKPSSLKELQEQMANMAAMGYNIPIGVFNGAITQQSDATNEFITYAVAPVAEVISDSLNAKLVGAHDYENDERAIVWLSRFKHVDVIDAANSLDKLRGIGFTLDEIFEMVGYPALYTDFSQARALTKNYSTEGLGEGTDAEDPADESGKNTTGNQKTRRKHRERRERRYEKC